MAKVDVELADGSKAGESLKSLTKEAAKLRKEVAGLTPGTKEFIASAKRLNEVEDSIKDVKDEIKSTVSASETLKEAWNNLPGAEYINRIAESFGMVKKGVGGLVSEFGLLKTAIAATGIGLLIVLLGSLFSWFKTTQEGADTLTSFVRPLKAVFEALKGVLQELGGKGFKTLSEAVKNPRQALKDLGQVLQDNVINRFKAFALIGPAIMKIIGGQFKQGFKDLGNAALQAVTGVENVIDKVADAGKAVAAVVDEAYKKGQRIDALQKQIEKDEIRQIIRSKQIELGLKKQLDIVEDVTKSWDARRAAAQRALQLQQESLNMELSLLDKRIEKMKIEQSLNDTSREQQKELAELEARKLELQAQTVEQSIEWKKKITEFDIAQAAEQAAIMNKLQALRLEAMNEGFAKEIAAIEQDTQQKIAALTGSETQIAEQRKLLQEIAERQVQEVRDKYAKEAEEKRKEQIEKHLSDVEGAARDEQLILLEQLASRQISEEEYNDELLSIQESTLQSQLEFLEQEGEQKSEKYKEIYGQLLQMRVDHNRQMEASDREMFNATLSGAGQLAAALAESYQTDIDSQQARLDRVKELHGEESAEYKKEQEKLLKIKKEQGEKRKRAERVQVGLNLISEISSIWTSVGSFGILAPVIGGILTAAALLRANSAMKKIDSAQFARGGELRGPSHAQGGLPFTVDGQPGFEAEGGEVLINKRSAAHFRRELSAINAFRGWGRKFATGGPVSPWPDQSRGPIPSGGSTQSSQPSMVVQTNNSEEIQLLREISNKLDAQIAAMDARIDSIEVHNNLQETQKGLNTLNRIRAEADV